MRTLKDLAIKIQQNPAQITELLTGFRTSSTEIRDFLFSMRQVPVYIVPALIHTFAEKHRENDPQTIRDLMHLSYIGSMFFLVEDGSDWTYVGVSTSGKPLCRPFNSAMILELDPDKSIKYVF